MQLTRNAEVVEVMAHCCEGLLFRQCILTSVYNIFIFIHHIMVDENTTNRVIQEKKEATKLNQTAQNMPTI